MSIIRNRMIKSLYAIRFKIVSIAQSTAGDVCLYDKINKKTIIVHGKFRKIHFPPENYTPIGIVVIPGNHNVYGENTCGVMSLVEMSCDTPSTGSITPSPMCFSPQTDLVIKNYNVVVIKDSDVLKTNGFGYLSKNGVYVSSTLKIPDPYNDDMSRNPDYYNTTVSAYNAMSDFEGKKNTNLVLGVRGVKNYSNWKPVYNTGTNYPAVSCCDMFSTEGTAQGQWFLPAAGEWGYITSKWNKLQKAIKMLNRNYGEIAMLLTDNASYWTCTEHNAKNNRYVHTNNGMGHTTKTTTMNIRALTIIKEELTFPIYLQTEMLDYDFYRRAADNLSLDIIDWYNLNCVKEENGNSHLESDVLSGKLFLDGSEITSMYFSTGHSLEFLFLETDNDYSLAEPFKVLQYRPTNNVAKGTIDIM